MTNISILVCDCCVLFTQALAMFIFYTQTTAIFKTKKNETTVASCGL